MLAVHAMNWDGQDGISYTVSVTPQKAHVAGEELIAAAAKAIDMYFDQGGFHLNLNVIDQKTLRTNGTTSGDTQI